MSESAGGAHAVVVESPPGSQVFTGSFTVSASITIDPNSGNVKDEVDIDGDGFAAAEDNIKITFGDTSVKAGITADDNGSWSTTFKVPDSVNGSHVVDAAGSTTLAADVPDRTFTVNPNLTIDPSTGGVGTPVTVTGTAFDSAESNIEVTYDDSDVRTGIVADVKGSWTVTFQVPNSTKGSHVVDASGDDTGAGDVPDATFTVLPRTLIKATSGFVGDEIEVMGSGFANNEEGIKITYDGQVIISKNLEADENGNWSSVLTIPMSTNGKHTIDAYGNTTVAADVLDSTVTVEAKILLNPKFGNVGETVTIAGTGFSKSKDISVSYGDTSMIPGLTTDSDGSFSSSFETPKNVSGEIIVKATDLDGIVASAKFTMESTPPPLPRIAAPKDGSRVGYIGDIRVTFDWTDVTDPSGFFYELEISAQSNFASTILKIDKLTFSEYTLTEAESLSHGEYYWRVRAIDEAGNASEWTAPALIKASYMTLQTLLIIIGCIIGLTILASVLPWVIRRIIKAVKTS
ncbi:MAG TPA: hypothetical protein G4O07_03705 [Dehalococcoidia bacterium]|nr:hypothetical protein [Dehalococcoidia bacterium]